MKKPAKIVLIIGVLGLIATVFNYFMGEIDWYANLLSLIASIGLIGAYLSTKKKAEAKEQ